MTTEEMLDGVDAVIVDWDGTVVDSQHANFTALNQALHSHGVQPTAVHPVEVVLAPEDDLPAGR